jgi:HD-GYP domain-containing protein (c-di-GMP phosphodiesterase class II)
MEGNTAQKEAIQVDIDSVIDGWVRLLSLKDHATARHSERVAQMAVFLASELGIKEPELNTIRRSALLADIGKIGVPDYILHKPGPLTEEEYMVVRKHIEYGRAALEPIPLFKPVIEIITCHHERWDGLGYPAAIKGEEIPLAARILSVAGVWDALRSDRADRPALPEAKAIQIMREQRGKLFDPKVVDAFLRIIESSLQP